MRDLPPTVPPVEVGTKCEQCETPITDKYFSVNGHATCPACEAQLAGSFGVSLGLGVVAAVLSVALYEAVLLTLHIRFVLVPVLAGVAIGSAVRRGARANRLARYRWLAVALTYVVAITTYALAMNEMKLSNDFLRIVVLPFVTLFEGKNFVTLTLLGFGLHEAWKFSAAPYANIEGPFRALAEGQIARDSQEIAALRDSQPAPDAAATPDHG